MVKNKKNIELEKGGAKEKIMEFYEKHFVVIWIIFVGIILILNFYLQAKFPSDKNLIVYFQTIFLGFITFSIPFLVSLYEKISKIRESSLAYSAEDIINRKIYEDLILGFKIYIFLPAFIILLGGLIFCRWFSLVLVWIYMGLAFILMVLYQTIVRLLEERGLAKHKDERLQMFVEASPLNRNLYNVFIEILGYSENDIEAKFSMNGEEWMKLFSSKLNELIEDIEGLEKEEKESLELILWRFSFFLEKANLENILWRSGFFKNFLNWNYIVWQIHQRTENFIILQSRLERIFKIILEKTLYSENYLYDLFFNNFINHIKTYEEKEKSYVEYFISEFSQIFFEEISKAPTTNKYDIWGLIPSDWKITSENLKNKKEISLIMLREFLRWAWIRIVNASKEELDESLNEVAYELFPKTEPILWATILIFAITPKKKVEDVINRPWTFGSSGRSKAFWGKMEEIEKKIEEDYNEQIRETVKLAKMIFIDEFTKENTENYLKEVKELENKYDKRSVEYYSKLEILKFVLEKLKEQ